MIDRIRKLGVAIQKAINEQTQSEAEELRRGLEKGLDEMEAEMTRLRRIALENHAIIEEVLKQRDYWSEKWKRHGVAHANAQAQMLEQLEGLDGAIAKKLLPELNRYREKEGLEPMKYTSALERFRTLFGDYKETLATTQQVGEQMPNDFLSRRRPVDP